MALSIQFATLEQFRSAHAGIFWKMVRDRYPDVKEHPPIPPNFETFGAPKPQRMFQLETFMSPPMPRYWFEKEGESDLLQVQQDRIIHNWRKVSDDQAYPRYPAIRAGLEKDVASFSKFLSDETLGDLRPNQCEVTYINVISFPDDQVADHATLEAITPLWSGKTTEPLPGELENAIVQFRCFLRDGSENVGRVYAAVQPAVRQSDSSSVFKIEITARGKPRDSSLDAAFNLLDLGREAVVRTFASITTKKMQKMWERKDATRK